MCRSSLVVESRDCPQVVVGEQDRDEDLGSGEPVGRSSRGVPDAFTAGVLNGGVELFNGRLCVPVELFPFRALVVEGQPMAPVSFEPVDAVVGRGSEAELEG